MIFPFGIYPKRACVRVMRCSCVRSKQRTGLGRGLGTKKARDVDGSCAKATLNRLRTSIWKMIVDGKNVCFCLFVISFGEKNKLADDLDCGCYSYNMLCTI